MCAIGSIEHPKVSSTDRNNSSIAIISVSVHASESSLRVILCRQPARCININAALVILHSVDPSIYLSGRGRRVDICEKGAISHSKIGVDLRIECAYRLHLVVKKEGRGDAAVSEEANVELFEDAIETSWAGGGSKGSIRCFAVDHPAVKLAERVA